MRTLIKDGTVVTASDTFAADVWIEDGKIAALAAPVSRAATADRTIDATGKYVIPGGIDAHTHLDMPFGGTTSSDDFETGTRRRGARRHDDDRRLRDPDEGRLAARGPRHLAREGRGQGRDRLRLPHDHDRRERRRRSRRWARSSARA